MNKHIKNIPDGDAPQTACRLCGDILNDANRCEAHILPRGLLKNMSKEEYGQLLTVGTEMDRKKRSPTGAYDTTILCRHCDNNKLGQYDDYVLGFINSSRLTEHPSGLGWTISGVDQEKLKLFLMSYLWRCSITGRKEFAGVSLGQKHEERLKRRILSNNSGAVDEYTMVIAKFDSPDSTPSGILLPARLRIRDLVYYEGYLPKLYKFFIKVDLRNDILFSNAALGSHSDLFVFNRGDFNESPEKSIMVRAAKRSR